MDEDPSRHAAALKEMKRGEKRDRGANERFQAGDGTFKSAKIGATVVVGRPIDKTAGWEVSPEMGVRYGTLADGTFNNGIPITNVPDEDSVMSLMGTWVRPIQPATTWSAPASASASASRSIWDDDDDDKNDADPDDAYDPPLGDGDDFDWGDAIAR